MGVNEAARLHDIAKHATAHGPEWVVALEEVSSLLPLALCQPQGRENVVRTLAKWCGQALCMEEAASLPIAINMRLLKAGLKLATGLAGCGDVASHALTEAGVAHQVLTLLFDDHMAYSLKLLELRALDTLLESYSGLKRFCNGMPHQVFFLFKLYKHIRSLLCTEPY